MRMWSVVFMLLVVSGLSLGQEHSDERLDALGYELMARTGAEPVDCPQDVLAESRYSILFCGSVRRSKGELIDAVRTVADSFLLDTRSEFSWAATADWEKRGAWFHRDYHVYDANVTVGVRRKPGIVFLRYPWQFPDCVAETPLPREGVGERTAPKILQESLDIRPQYPELMRVSRIEAAVFLQGRISREGTVEDLCVQHATRPDLGFEQAALEAAGQWRYEPATINGEAIEVRFSLLVEFRLH